MQSHTYRSRICNARSVVALFFSIALVFTLVAPRLALAVPDSGAGSDTPGTYAEVTTKTLQPGATIKFYVTGYPAGETVYIKIDDGSGYSDTTTAGSGVVHTQKIASDGTVSGSFQLPSDISQGGHWLRFLASEEVSGKGVLGYTQGAGSTSNSGHPTFFTVAGESLGGKTLAETTGTVEHPGATDGESSSTDRTVGDGSVVDLGTGETLSEEDAAAAAAEATFEKDGSAENEDEALSTDSALAENTAATDDSIPVVGIAALAVAIVVGAGVVIWAIRKKPASSSVPETDVEAPSDSSSETDPEKN